MGTQERDVNLNGHTAARDTGGRSGACPPDLAAFTAHVTALEAGPACMDDLSRLTDEILRARWVAPLDKDAAQILLVRLAVLAMSTAPPAATARRAKKQPPSFPRG